MILFQLIKQAGFLILLKTGIILLLVLHIRPVRGEENLLVTLNTVHARPLALGGAFVTFEDDLAALAYNPAGFNPGPAGKSGLSWFLNPLGPVLCILQSDRFSDSSVPVTLSLVGAGYTAGRVRLGLILGEESLTETARLQRSRFFDLRDYEVHRNTAVGFSIALAPKVSIGAAVEWYIRDGGWRRARFGHRYGIIVRPRTNIAVGLCYLDMPEGAGKERLSLDRFPDETLNIGVSFSPWTWVTIAADVRNVSDEGRQKGVEPHAGLEIRIIDGLNLRGGFYKLFGDVEQGVSVGFGIPDVLTLLIGRRENFNWRIKFEAAAICQKVDTGGRKWILTSLQWMI